MSCEQIWLGGPAATSVRAVAKLALSSSSARLACWDAAGNWVRGNAVATVGNIARLEVTGLTPNTAYQCRIEPGNSQSRGVVGSFTTLPSGTNVSFKMLMIGDADSGSNHQVFETARTLSGARFGVHLGDFHYRNNNINDQANFRPCVDEVFAQSRQAALYRAMPWVLTPDDHCYCGNNSDGTATAHDAWCAFYRARYPYHDLADATVTAPIHHTFDVGRTRIIVTDLRSAASPRANTDNSSKTMMGASQKTWFKDLIQNSPGKLLVWVCSRHFTGDATVGADHWGGFTTERTELVDHIKTHAHGRLVVLSADMHAMRIGVDRDFATGGGEALRVFNVATLDHPTIDTGGYGGVSSTGSERWEATNGLFATMQVTDNGGPIDVTWGGMAYTGLNAINDYPFQVTV